MESIFNENKRPYRYGKDSSDDFGPPEMTCSKSDLPLRNDAATSDVRPKEVLAPDPNKAKVLGRGDIPNISSVNMGTIKQNRLLNKTGGGGLHSDSSGDEVSDTQKGELRTPKRNTMAWQPDYGVLDQRDEEPIPPPDPFSQFRFPSNEGQSSFNLAPPTAIQRPGLHQANTAPGDIPTAPHLSSGGQARASTVSMLDIDALFGDEAPSASDSGYSFSQPVNQFHQPLTQQEPGSDPYDDVSIYSTVASHVIVESSQTQHQASSSINSHDDFQGGLDPSSPTTQQQYSINPEEFITPNSPLMREPPALVLTDPRPPPQPPSQEAMADNAPPNVVAEELTRLVMETLEELGGLGQDMTDASGFSAADLNNLNEDEDGKTDSDSD